MAGVISLSGIAWSKDFELGCELVDDQHKRLFELVNNITSACNDGLGTKILNETLDFLVSYTVQHFIDEEALQIKYDFPDYERHKSLHEDFKQTVGEKVTEFKEKGSTKSLNDTVNKIIVRWLVNHILMEDMKIGVHIKNIEKA